MNLMAIDHIRSNENRAPLIMAWLLIFMISVLVSDAWNQEDSYSVAAIHVHLYYQSTGEIDSRDLLDGKLYNLWNIIAGMGVARMPSCAVLAVVDLEGPSFEKIDGELTMKATVGDRTLLERTLQLRDWYSAGRRLSLPFLIYGTGCEELEICATLQGLPSAMVKVGMLKRSVPFACGD